MSHDEDVRLVDYLRKRLVQAADRDHVDYAVDARHADHEALAQIANLRAERDALMEEHEAGKHMAADMRESREFPRDRAWAVAHDNVKRLMKGEATGS